MRCCFCGPVKNCGAYIDAVLDNIRRLGALFDEYEVFLVYDRSHDDTLRKIQRRQRADPRIRVRIVDAPISIFRTHRIAYARNCCLDFLRRSAQSDAPFDFFAMMDFDDPNAKRADVEVLRRHLARQQEWDAISFHTRPAYYDIWALSLHPYCFSYNHFRSTSTNNYAVIQRYVTRRLAALAPGELLRCISAFNGFAVYRTSVFLDCRYDGRVRVDAMRRAHIDAHAAVARSALVYPDLGHVKAFAEDCEHRAFHAEALAKRDARIMISPAVLFPGEQAPAPVVRGNGHLEYVQ